MRTYTMSDMDQKKVDYINMVIPLLSRFGFKREYLVALLNNNNVRLRWGKNWNDFTVHIENPLNDLTCKIDNDIHKLWAGEPVQNCMIVTCFLTSKGIGPVSSVAITDLYTLANCMMNHGKVHKVRNSFNGQTFMTLPFSHPSLSNNIWIIGSSNGNRIKGSNNTGNS